MYTQDCNATLLTCKTKNQLLGQIKRKKAGIFSVSNDQVFQDDTKACGFDVREDTQTLTWTGQQKASKFTHSTSTVKQIMNESWRKFFNYDKTMIVNIEDNHVSYTLSNLSVTSLPMRNSYTICEAEPYIKFLFVELVEQPSITVLRNATSSHCLNQIRCTMSFRR